VHQKLGYGSFPEYLSAVFGYDHREAQERTRVALRLAELPGVSQALRNAELVWSGAREIGRVATADTEEQWLERTRGKSVRQIEKMVAGRQPGDAPDDPADPPPDEHVLRFEVDGTTLATWREAVKKMRAEHGGKLSGEEALLAIARRVLEGPTDEGRSSYQIALTVCEECGATTQDGAGEPIPVDEQTREMAYCDSQIIGHVDAAHVGQGGSEGQRATQTIPPAKRRAVVRRDHSCCAVDDCRNAIFVDVHHLTWRIDGGQHDIDAMTVLCGAHHQAVHAGTLRIEGKPSTGLSFLHADGSPYGSRWVDARAAGAQTELFVELTQLGLAADEAWRSLDQARP
jgi:hypothetical protein